MNNYKIIAHRGVFNNITTPENSIKAFKKALFFNYPIELDIRLTKDNILVVYHDENLERLTGINKNIEELTYTEITKLRLLDTDQVIPKFSDVLKLVNDKVLLDIEIKKTKKIKIVCNKIMQELKNYKNYDLKSFDPRIVRYLKKNYKDIKVGYLINSKYPNKMYNLILKNNFIINYCNPDFLAIHKRLLLNKKFQKLTKKYPTMIWTIKKKDEFTNSKFSYICNNLPFY